MARCDICKDFEEGVGLCKNEGCTAMPDEDMFCEFFEVNNEKVKEHLQDLLNLESGLDEWQLNFVEDMSKIDTFTEKQANKIMEIYEQRC